MKIVRLGQTETSLLFLTYFSKNFQLEPQLKRNISKLILSLLNWLYSTSGYYDKNVKGTYFDFDVTALNKNFFKYIEHLQIAVSNCETTQFFFHDSTMQLLKQCQKEFIEKFNIRNFTILNGTEFQDRIDDILKLFENKKLLVITSFDGLVKQQYESGNLYKIYEKFPKLQNLETYKFPYCFNNSGPHNNYFETLESVFNDISKIDFDIAVLGCGAYGHMLCHKIDADLHKDAIYVGGSIQTLFGILSSREKQHGKIKYNEYWITTIPEEYKPSNYKSVENGCYW
jgi:hypothetical protein